MHVATSSFDHSSFYPPNSSLIIFLSSLDPCVEPLDSDSLQKSLIIVAVVARVVVYANWRAVRSKRTMD